MNNACLTNSTITDDIEILQQKSSFRKDTARRKRRRNVSFSGVDIHEHYYILDDNPSCSEGPPVTISWNFIKLVPMTVDDFEAYKRPNRTMRDFKMSTSERISLLLQSGHTMDQLLTREHIFEFDKRDNNDSSRKMFRPKTFLGTSRLLSRFVRPVNRSKSKTKPFSGSPRE